MIASSILVILLQTGFVLLVALVVGRLTAKKPPFRSAVYRLSIIAALALAIGSPWLRERPNPVVPIRWAPAAVITPNFTGRSTADTARQRGSAAPIAPKAVTARPDGGTPIDPVSLLPAIWLTGIALLGIHFTVGYLGLRRISGRCRPVEDAYAVESLTQIAAQAGVLTPHLVEGASVGNPFVAGVIRPTIFLPADWEVESSVLDAVLRHETAHVANGDLRWNLLHRVVCIALWPQPLLWLLRRRMMAVNEELCDQQVVASGIPGAHYAECLLNLRESLLAKPCPALGIGAVSHRSALSRRVEAILDPTRSRSLVLSRRLSISLVIGAVLFAGGAALLFARPASHAVQGQAPQDKYAGWITKPYAGQAEIRSPEGQGVDGAEAWMELTGDLPAATAKRLEVKGNTVSWSIDNLPPRTTAILVVRAKGYALEWAPLWPAPTVVTSVGLQDPVALRGRFFQPNGRPAANVKVRATLLMRKGVDLEAGGFLDLTCIPGLNVGGTTAADGSFGIQGLPKDVRVGYEADDDPFAQLSFSDRLDIGTDPVTRAPNVTLEYAASFTGRVTRDGAPVVGVRIGTQGTNDPANIGLGGNSVTDQNGRYTISRLRPGVYNVIANLQNGMDRDVTAVAHEGVRVKAGDQIANLDFQLIPGVLIVGRVTGEDGKPLPETDVGVYGPSHPNTSAWVQSALTDKDGFYRLRVPPGKQYVYVMDGRYTQDAHTVNVESDSKRVDFQVKAAEPDNEALGYVGSADEDAKPENEPAESVPTPPVLSFGPGKPFYGPAKLAGGGTATLAFVQVDESKPHTLWRPDGSRAAPADVARSLDMTGFTDKKPVRSILLRVDIDGIPRGSYDCVVQVPQVSNWSVWQSYGDQNNRTMDMASFDAASTLRVTDMRFGIASGRYRILESGQIGEAPLFARVKPGDHRIDMRAGAEIAVRIPSGIEDKDVKLAAYDRSGKSLDLMFWETSDTKDKSGAPTRSYGFSGARPDDIARVELIARDYEWVTFKGIHLYPRSR